MASITEINVHSLQHAKVQLQESKVTVDSATKCQVAREGPQGEFTNLLFISNQGLLDNVREKLCGPNAIVKFKVNAFQNRSCQQLLDTGVQHIWVNVSIPGAVEWLQSVITQPNPYTVVQAMHTVGSEMKRMKFITDLQPYTDISIKYEHLKKAETLTASELITMIKTHFRLHDPDTVSKVVLTTIAKKLLPGVLSNIQNNI